MNRIFVAWLLLCITATALADGCPRFDATKSSAYDPTTKSINLLWRTDFPTTVPTNLHKWQGKSFNDDWKSYINAILEEVKDSGITIQNGKIAMPSSAPWWITPWMDFGPTGRERLLGLTQERAPDPNDLGPNSSGGLQTWAIGWYNVEGAVSLGQIFADPCNPTIPSVPSGARWTFLNQTASFKFLFTEASDQDVTYLKGGAPTVQAITRNPNTPTTLRLIQVDVAVRDPNAKDTGWVFGTFIWKGPAKGDGLFDNLIPVGLTWGNDPKTQSDTLSGFAPLRETKLNADLAGLVWQGSDQSWPQRPYPGFQGRLNGPADNWRSSCMSCHSAAQYPRNPTLGIPHKMQQTDSLTANDIAQIVSVYFGNVQSGHLIDPMQDIKVPLPAAPLDYSLQLQTAFVRICQACQIGAIQGETPSICLAAHNGPINTPTCPTPNL